MLRPCKVDTMIPGTVPDPASLRMMPIAMPTALMRLKMER